MPDSDVLILGAGPAGSAAAIAAAGAGLRVALVERSAFPRSAPGESLHPGVMPLLRQLGVERQVLAAGFLRHEGHFVQWNAPRRFVPFGADEEGPWLGLQAWRPAFDALLLERARQLGVRVLQPCRPVGLRRSGAAVAGVVTDRGAVESTFVVDATGRRRWLSRQLGLHADLASPPLTAWYGYLQDDDPDPDRDPSGCPTLVGASGGWTWTARVRPNLRQWTQLSLNHRQRPGAGPPPQLAPGKPLGRARGVDVTWAVAAAPAGPGYYLVGDAAANLDPASSHGVLRAIMSGIMAAHLIAAVAGGKISQDDAAAAYTLWVRDWFAREVAALRELYAVLTSPGPGP